MYYIAYGANLNIKHMQKMCKYSKPIFKLNGSKVNRIEGWKLSFNKYANIIPCKNSYVPIGLWMISKRCEKKLDIYEQFPTLYKKLYLKIQNVNAMIYVMNQNKKQKPTKNYFEAILKGYDNFNLDKRYLYSSILNKNSF